MVWHELVLTHKHGCRKRGRNLKISAKNIFLVSSVKNQISPLLSPLGKLLEKSTSGPPGKIPSDAHARKHVKLHQFCEKMCCITLSGNTVHQHQCGKQIAGRQTVHGVFCQTITESCWIHCQIRNKILEIISTKFCNTSFIKRFALTLDPILLVLLKITIFRQNSKGP